MLLTAGGAAAGGSSGATSHTCVTTTGVDELAWAARSCRGLVRAAREEAVTAHGMISPRLLLSSCLPGMTHTPPLWALLGLFQQLGRETPRTPQQEPKVTRPNQFP